MRIARLAAAGAALAFGLALPSLAGARVTPTHPSSAGLATAATPLAPRVGAREK